MRSRSGRVLPERAETFATQRPDPPANSIPQSLCATPKINTKQSGTRQIQNSRQDRTEYVQIVTGLSRPSGRSSAELHSKNSNDARNLMGRVGTKLLPCALQALRPVRVIAGASSIESVECQLEDLFKRYLVGKGPEGGILATAVKVKLADPFAICFVKDFLMRASVLGLCWAGWLALTNLTRWKPRDVGAALWGKRRRQSLISVRVPRIFPSLEAQVRGFGRRTGPVFRSFCGDPAPVTTH